MRFAFEFVGLFWRCLAGSFWIARQPGAACCARARTMQDAAWPGRWLVGPCDLGRGHRRREALFCTPAAEMDGHSCAMRGVLALCKSTREIGARNAAQACLSQWLQVDLAVFSRPTATATKSSPHRSCCCLHCCCCCDRLLFLTYTLQATQCAQQQHGRLYAWPCSQLFTALIVAARRHTLEPHHTPQTRHWDFPSTPRARGLMSTSERFKASLHQ